MTPSKTKRPLPSSTSTIFPEQPGTYTEWQTTIEQVKLLYLKREYKQCAARCIQVLSDSTGNTHPLNTTFLHFYAALSYELIARSSHNLSTSKLPTLNLAKESYHAAAAALPQPEYVASDDDSSSMPFSDSSSTASSDADLPTSDDNSPSNLTDSDNHESTTTYPSSPSSVSSTDSIYADVPKPSPLRIRKAVHFNTNTNPTTPATATATQPPSPSRSINNHSPVPPSPSSPPPTRPLSHTSITFTPPTTIWLQTRSLHRYNTHLSSFSSMLSTHVHTINNLINLTNDAQKSRYTGQVGTRTISASSEDGAEEGKRVRIEKGRAREWKRERFAPGRYEELCAMALAEL
ncbi:MAG: hypothetical protein M1830_006261 [Pleopsidium flavum]|nr:MAG: hypothetical protein M1830_006261 [Pleopsidium flavum]